MDAIDANLQRIKCALQIRKFGNATGQRLELRPLRPAEPTTKNPAPPTLVIAKEKPVYSDASEPQVKLAHVRSMTNAERVEGMQRNTEQAIPHTQQASAPKREFSSGLNQLFGWLAKLIRRRD